MLKKVEEFINKYKELKKLIFDVTETLNSYITEAISNVNKFEEFLADYSFKISAVVFNAYDDNKKKIFKLLDWLDKKIKEDKTFKGLGKHTASLRKELEKFEKLYEQGAVTDGEMKDTKYYLEEPFEEIEIAFDDKDWDYTGDYY